MKLLYSRKFTHGSFKSFDQRPEKIIELNQTHSINILPFEKYSPMTEADGICISYEQLKSKPVAIKTADCMPILIMGADSIVFLHAGWRGLAHGILNQGIIKSINPHTAFIGPSISASSFEVSKDFKENFPDSAHFEKQAEKYFFDLQNEARDQLLALYPDISVEDCAECTYKQSKYHSYRRDKTSKRNWNLFSISL